MIYWDFAVMTPVSRTNSFSLPVTLIFQHYARLITIYNSLFVWLKMKLFHGICLVVVYIIFTYFSNNPVFQGSFWVLPQHSFLNCLFGLSHFFGPKQQLAKLPSPNFWQTANLQQDHASNGFCMLLFFPCLVWSPPENQHI